MANQHYQKIREVGQVYFVLPAYNEEKSLPNLLRRILSEQKKSSKRLKVIVIDDGSSDNTASIVTEGIAGLDVKLVSHEQNSGLGQALQTGIKEALYEATDNDVIIVMDADDTHDVTLLNPMIEKIERGADIVIASRFVEGGDDSSAPLFRRLLSRGAVVVFTSLLPLKGIHDFTSGYRAYYVPVLNQASTHWGERLIEEQGFACMVELLMKLRYWSPVIDEVPLNLRYDRKIGASKLKLARTIFQYLKLGLRDYMAPAPKMTKSGVRKLEVKRL